MSNQENEFVRMGIPDPDEVITKFIGKDGLECEEYSSFAKKSLTTSGTSQYFVRVGRGELIDPYGIDDNLSRKRISDVFKFKKVNKKVLSLVNLSIIIFSTKIYLKQWSKIIQAFIYIV